MLFALWGLSLGKIVIQVEMILNVKCPQNDLDKGVRGRTREREEKISSLHSSRQEGVL